MPTPEELQSQIDSLTAKLNAALNRISELEDFAGGHLGLDWGESLVDANSPHPNMSVNTIESGGGVVRQDSQGMQIRAPGTDSVPAIYYLREFSPEIGGSSPYPRATIAGYVETSSATLILSSASGSTSYSSSIEVQSGQSSTSGMAVISLYDGSFGTTGQIFLEPLGGGKARLRLVNTVLSLPYDTSDPSFPADGYIWYRSDTNKFRGRSNSLTDSFAMESWVAATTTFNFIDAKGDIAVGSADNTIDNLAVGSDGQFLTADSSQTLGLKWGNLTISNDISPAQITSNQNDYNPTGLSTASVLRLNSDAARDITGLAGGTDGRVLLIFNAGSQDLVLKDESASSTEANRFALNGDITLQPDNSVGLWYDSVSSRWRAF